MTFFLLLCSLFFGHAASIYDHYQDRSDSQWTLGKWLYTKQQSKLMDQWLARNRKAKKDFDLQIGYGQREVENIDSGAIKDYQGLNMGIYYSFLGIEGDYHKNDDDSEDRFWKAALSLRLLGSSQQSTYWSVYYGLRKEESQLTSIKNNYYGSRINLYLFSHLGVYADYNILIENEEDQNSKGDIFNYGAFLEVFFIRAYYKWTQENLERSSGNIENEAQELGLIIFY